jgi:hypothetical protein
MASLLPLVALALVALPAQKAPLPGLTFGDGWGVNIHFTRQAPGELRKIREAGFRWIRMDLFWHDIEKQKGVYDFSGYDQLVRDCEQEGLRILFILCYGNDIYQKGSPRTPESRRAFANYVRAAVERYKGKGILWEMWNEPNIFFWQPYPNVEDYILLAKEVGRTIRSVSPDELYVGPATSGFDWGFLERCFRAGLLREWDAVTVHPYREAAPETAAKEWPRLRQLVDMYAPPGKNIPLLSGEWGYSDAWPTMDRQRQAHMIQRQYLSNLANHVGLSIWYDWKNDGPDRKEYEHNFGTVEENLDPKPAYLAAQKLSRRMEGQKFLHRLETGIDNAHLLTFAKDGRLTFVAWMQKGEGTIPLPVETEEGKTEVKAGSEPTVLLAKDTQAARDLIAWEGVQREASPWLEGDAQGRWRESRLRLANGRIVRQTVRELPLQPLDLVWLPGEGVRIENPSGRRFRGTISVGSDRREVQLAEFQTSLRVPLKLQEGQRVRLRNEDGRTLVTREAPRFQPLFASAPAARLAMDGEAQAVAKGEVQTQGRDLVLRYESNPGGKFFMLQPEGEAAKPIAGRPTHLILEVEGDGSGDMLKARIQDATGQIFQPETERMNFKGWRTIVFPLNDPNTWHWGGPNDGKVRYPIRIDTLLLIERPGRAPMRSSIRVRNVTLAFASP